MDEYTKYKLIKAFRLDHAHRASAEQVVVLYLRHFGKWLLASVLIGFLGGLLGILFRVGVERAGELNAAAPWLLWLLPVAGLLTAAMYHFGKSDFDRGANVLIDSVLKGENISWKVAPRIFFGTLLTHLCGGSAGKEGAALQLGGVVGMTVSKLLRLDDKDRRLAILCGMSALFSALFGVPVTAAIFALEVISVGVMYYAGLLPCVIASVIGYHLTLLAGLAPLRFALTVPELSLWLTIRLGLFGVACALVSSLFCVAVHQTGKRVCRGLHNIFVEAALGGALLILLTLIVGSRDYNGLGMAVIDSALAGRAAPLAWFWKIAFTAVTIGFGFKGGEIIPTLFIGATFGCVCGGWLGIDPGLGAALGMVALFCGVTNCPLASLALSVELFGGPGLLFFALVVAVSYVFSGYYGLYSSQRILYSKLKAEFVNLHAE